MTNHSLRDIIDEIKIKERLKFGQIASKARANRGYLSTIINAKEPMGVTSQLHRKLYKAFPSYFTNPDEHVKTDKSDKTEKTEISKPDDYYREKYISLLEQENKNKEKIIEISLNSLAEGQNVVQAQLRTIHQWDAMKDAEQKANTEAELEPLYNKATETIQRIFTANLAVNSTKTKTASQSSQEGSGQSNVLAERKPLFSGIKENDLIVTKGRKKDSAAGRNK